MPQMAPLFWSLLYMFFVTLLMLMLSKLYFLKEDLSASAAMIKKNKMNNWMW